MWRVRVQRRTSLLPRSLRVLLKNTCTRSPRSRTLLAPLPTMRMPNTCETGARSSLWRVLQVQLTNPCCVLCVRGVSQIGGLRHTGRPHRNGARPDEHACAKGGRDSVSRQPSLPGLAHGAGMLSLLFFYSLLIQTRRCECVPHAAHIGLGFSRGPPNAEPQRGAHLQRVLCQRKRYRGAGLRQLWTGRGLRLAGPAGTPEVTMPLKMSLLRTRVEANASALTG